jgi:hypothetical protein
VANLLCFQRVALVVVLGVGSRGGNAVGGGSIAVPTGGGVLAVTVEAIKKV